MRARKSNQSILKEINPEYSLEGLMLKLKAPVLWPLDAKSWLTGKGLMLGKIDGKMIREQQKMRWIGSITDSTAMNLSKLRR